MIFMNYDYDRICLSSLNFVVDGTYIQHYKTGALIIRFRLCLWILQTNCHIPCVGAGVPLACPQSFCEKISWNALIIKSFWAPRIFYLHVNYEWTISYKSDLPGFQAQFRSACPIRLTDSSAQPFMFPSCDIQLGHLMVFLHSIHL